MKIRIKSFGFINLLTCFILAYLWMAVFLLHGLAGAVSWALLKLVFPLVGVVAFTAHLTLLLVNLRKKKTIRAQAVGMALGVVMIVPILFTVNAIPFAYPVRLEKMAPSVTVMWPLAEQTVIGWGGDTTSTNSPHVSWASERWAYDLVMPPYNTGDSTLESYGIWDKEVLAPIAGIVVEAYGDEEDIAPHTEDFKSMEGNHVYIRINETGTYLLLNHLKQGSLTVNSGDAVVPGQIIGRVGNSGSTSEPHLHIHHQRQDPTKTLHPILAEGLPLYFEGIDTAPMPERGRSVTPNTSVR